MPVAGAVLSDTKLQRTTGHQWRVTPDIGFRVHNVATDGGHRNNICGILLKVNVMAILTYL